MTTKKGADNWSAPALFSLVPYAAFSFTVSFSSISFTIASRS